MKSILVVGIGNFGSWWVISLNRIKTPLKIYCFDPDFSNYEILKKRLAEDRKNILEKHKIQFLDKLTEAPKKFDVIVISTNSDVRLKVIKNLRKLFSTKKWIIEKVVAQSPDQLKSLSECLQGQEAYVNHSRRLQPASKFCKSILKKKSLPTSVIYVGGRWELASNSFHFVDLISYWFETSLVKINTDGLSNQWHASSTRKGYFDTSGILSAKFANELQFKMNWNNGIKDALWIFEYDDCKIKYDEITGQIYENETFLATFPLLNFSEMGLLLEPTLMGDLDTQNKLPLLTEVEYGTSLLLEAFLSNWISSTNSKNQIAPIS